MTKEQSRLYRNPSSRESSIAPKTLYTSAQEASVALKKERANRRTLEESQRERIEINRLRQRLEKDTPDAFMDTTEFDGYIDESAPSRQSSRLAVHESQGGKWGYVGSRSLNRNRRPITEVKARKESDIKRNARRGESIRDLEEVSPGERSKGFVDALDEISSEVSDSGTDDTRDSALSSSTKNTTSETKHVPQQVDRDVRRVYRSKSHGRETIRRVPINQPRASQGQTRSLRPDATSSTAVSERFKRQEGQRKAERDYTNSLFKRFLGFFGR